MNEMFKYRFSMVIATTRRKCVFAFQSRLQNIPHFLLFVVFVVPLCCTVSSVIRNIGEFAYSACIIHTCITVYISFDSIRCDQAFIWSCDEIICRKINHTWVNFINQIIMHRYICSDPSMLEARRSRKKNW